MSNQLINQFHSNLVMWAWWDCDLWRLGVMQLEPDIVFLQSCVKTFHMKDLSTLIKVCLSLHLS